MSIITGMLLVAIMTVGIMAIFQYVAEEKISSRLGQLFKILITMTAVSFIAYLITAYLSIDVKIILRLLG